MVPDHLCVPGLDRPVTVSEYTKLKGVREAEVLAAIQALKIRSAYFRGQWYVEAPRNCEARLAQLRGPTPAAPTPTPTPHQANDSGQKIGGNPDKLAVAAKIGNAPVRKNKLTWRGFAALAASAWLVALLIWAAINPSQPIFSSDRSDTSSIIGTVFFGLPFLAGLIFLVWKGFAPVAPKRPPQPAAAAAQPSAAQHQAESELARLRARVKTEMPSYGSLTDSEKKALLAMTECAEVPQPVDYGVTQDETWHRLRVDGQFRHELPEGGFSKFRYKAGKWVRFRDCVGETLAIFLPVYFLGFLFFAALNPNLPGGWVLDNPRALAVFFLGMLLPGWILWGISYVIAEHRAERYKQRHVSNNLMAFLWELHLHNLHVAAKGEAEEAARKAARDAELRKRSYWTFLDGYAFERATAEVLNKHQFNAVVTPGSGDGGIDIQVTRNGLKGVVQCKAHMACAGPHVVRDLYRVIHHLRADFGIIVSLGGFTKGAVEFARDKPILFLDVSDLIAMQEGRDVLAAAFAPDDTIPRQQ